MPDFLLQTLRSAAQLALAGFVVVLALVVYAFFRPPIPAPLLAKADVPGPPLVSVVLGHARNVKQLVIACDGPYDVAVLPREERVSSGDILAGMPIVAQGQDLLFGQADVQGAELRLRPVGTAAVAVNGKRYAGCVRVVRTGDGVTAYNDLDIESYLEGVLGAEMLLNWNEAALEAQAIVARTYAMHEIKQARSASGGKAAALLDNVNAQVYKGLAVRTPRAAEIVRRTRGMVLIHGGELIRAFFHNTCGGATEPAHLFFEAPDIAPLMGRSCGFCNPSPHATWRATLTKKELGALLAAFGNAEQRPVTQVAVVHAAASGRATQVSFSTAGGVSGRTVKAVDFRLAIGPERLRSTWFEFADMGATIEFSGKGWGHGVGLCQWGARGMGDAGLGSLEILRFYYPNADVVRIY